MMSSLKVNVKEFRTSIAKDRVFMLCYKQTIETKPQRKVKKSLTPSTVNFLKSELQK